MADLAIGDNVLVDTNTYSTVYMFSHRLSDVHASFVKIVTADHTIMLTQDHYIYVNNKLSVASSVHVGDVLIASDGTNATVTAVSMEVANGMSQNATTIDTCCKVTVVYAV